MATRSIVSVFVGFEARHFYRHFDGMPYRCGADLATLLYRVDGDAEAFIAALEGASYEHRDKPRVVFDEFDPGASPVNLDATDCDWLYEVYFTSEFKLPRFDPGPGAGVFLLVRRRAGYAPLFAGDREAFMNWIDATIRTLNAEYEADLQPLRDLDGRFARPCTCYEGEG